MTKCFVLPLLLTGLLFVAGVSTTQGKEKDKTTATAAVATVTMSKKENGPATTSFGAGDPAIYATVQRAKPVKGDKIRFVWILEDGGKTVTPNAKVSEYTAIGTDLSNAKEFSHLDKPAAGWPLGKWRTDVYVNDVKAASVKFTLK